MKSLEQKQDKQQQEDEDITTYLREKHVENQSKLVQKRMKQTRKKSKRANNNKKKPFSGRKAYKFKTKIKKWIGM